MVIDRARLSKGVPAFVRMSCRRVPGDLLEQAQDDAAELAIRDMERAGIDVITDGEVRRESYSNHLVAALEGIDSDHPATLTSRAVRTSRCPGSSATYDARRVEIDASGCSSHD